MQSLSRFFRDVPREKTVIIWGFGPVLFIHGSAHRDGNDPQLNPVGLPFGGFSGLQFKRQGVIARLPILLAVQPIILAILPCKFLLQKLVIVLLETEMAGRRIKIERPPRHHLNQQLIGSRVFSPKARHQFRRLIVRQRQQTFPADCSPAPAPANACRRAIRPEPVPGNHSFRHHARNCRHRLIDDSAGRSQIFFEQHRRQREHVPDIVKAVARVVGGEFRLGVKIDSQQIKNRVAVFDPVQPPNGDTARIGVFGIDAKRVILDPVFQPLLLFGGRPRFFGGRHDAGPGVFQGVQPKIMAQKRITRFQFVKGHAPFAFSITMAIIAVLGENGLDVLAEMRDRRRVRPRRAKTQGHQRQQAGQACFAMERARGRPGVHPGQMIGPPILKSTGLHLFFFHFVTTPKTPGHGPSARAKSTFSYQHQMV